MASNWVKTYQSAPTFWRERPEALLVVEHAGILDVELGGAGGYRRVELEADQVLGLREDLGGVGLAGGGQRGGGERQVVGVEPDDLRVVREGEVDRGDALEGRLGGYDRELGGVAGGLDVGGEPQRRRRQVGRWRRRRRGLGDLGWGRGGVVGASGQEQAGEKRAAHGILP